MATHAPLQSHPTVVERWTTYFHERFPPGQYAIALAAFAWAALAYVQAIDADPGLPRPYPFAASLAMALAIFLQLRILDEFKDAEDDAKYRPYRPLPRGLVTRAGLARLWAIAFVVELAIAATLGARVIMLLLLVLAYSGLMAVEFFVRDWLRAHALAYLASHMLIVPMVAMLVMATSQREFGVPEVAPFLALSYASFCIFELGRKTYAPAEERTGVETYSALWGLSRAVRAWIGTTFLAAIAGWLVARQAGIPFEYLAAASFLTAASLVTGVRFVARPQDAKGKDIAMMSGAWLVGLHLAIGAAIALQAPA